MKNKILTFVIGILVGAIITTIGFFIYQKINRNNFVPNGNMEQMRERGNGGTRPEKPSDKEGNTSPIPENTNQNSKNTSNT